ncbi:hypothetical protein [Exiguobacterium aurantiacum]|uniref:hypothetical protein n=1 Tax=Exiguobacterium aurantiacum TaxID=33987 RepID=UPI003CFDFC7B
MKEQPATAIEVKVAQRGKWTASSRRRRTLPQNPNKQTTKISADKSIARLKEENRAVIYGYRD